MTLNLLLGLFEVRHQLRGYLEVKGGALNNFRGYDKADITANIVTQGTLQKRG